MRLSLSIIAGQGVGRKIWLVAGQLAEVGRAATMDLAVPGDTALAETHFVVSCARHGCHVRDASGAGLTVNGQPAVERELADGDRIAAGQTTFAVRIEGLAKAPPPVAESVAEAVAPLAAAAWALVAAPTAAAVCEDVRLDEETDDIDQGLPPREFLAQLRERGCLIDAVRFLAHALPKREAVGWAWECVRLGLGPSSDPADLAATAAAEAWLREPNENRRQATMPAAEATGFESPAGLVAMAASFSGGSLTPPEFEPVPPGELLTAQAATAAILAAAVENDPPDPDERHAQFLDLGQAVAAGQLTWAPPAPPAAPPRRG